MAYENCAEVSQEIWNDLEKRDPAEVAGRTGVIFREGEYELPFLDRELRIDPARRQIRVLPGLEGDPDGWNHGGDKAIRGVGHESHLTSHHPAV